MSMSATPTEIHYIALSTMSPPIEQHRDIKLRYYVDVNPNPMSRIKS